MIIIIAVLSLFLLFFCCFNTLGLGSTDPDRKVLDRLELILMESPWIATALTRWMNRQALKQRGALDTWEMHLPKCFRNRSPALLIGLCRVYVATGIKMYVSAAHIFCSVSFGSHLHCPTRRPRRHWQIYNCTTVAIDGSHWTRHVWQVHRVTSSLSAPKDV